MAATRYNRLPFGKQVVCLLLFMRLTGSSCRCILNPIREFQMAVHSLLAPVGILGRVAGFIAYGPDRPSRSQAEPLLSAVRWTAEEHTFTLASMALTALLGFASFLGASSIQASERVAMQILVVT